MKIGNRFQPSDLMFQATKFTKLFQFSYSASAFRARLRIVGFVCLWHSEGVTRNELTRRFPHASPSFIKANLDPDDSGPCAAPKIDVDNQVDLDNIEFVDVKKIQELYLIHKSVHTVGDIIGVCGETVRRRLNELGVTLDRRAWTDAEIEELRTAYASEEFSIEQIAAKLSRPYAGIACKADDLGLCARRGTYKRTDATRAKISAAQKEVSARPGVSAKRGMAVSEAFKKNGHPRGMLGKHHTEETKEALSKSNTGRKVPRERIERQMRTTLERYGKIPPATKRGSWIAEWVTVGGQRFFARSRWEANYARYLEWQKSIGEILAWEHEPKTFWFEGIKRGVRSYLPDFLVTMKNGNSEWHEVKGWMDSKSKTKIKRMAKYHPNETLRVFDGKWFKTANRKIGKIVPGWDFGN